MAVKHLSPLFLTASVQNKNLEVFLEKSGAYKFKYTIHHQTPIKAKYGAFYLKLYSRNLNIKAKSEVKPLKTCRKYLKKIN